MRRIKHYYVRSLVKNNRLFQLRREAGLTQAEMAAAIGVSVGSYGGLEGLRTFPHSIWTSEWRKPTVGIGRYWAKQELGTEPTAKQLEKRMNWLFPPTIIQRQVDRYVAELWFNEIPAQMTNV
jgi:transcriptional regulator with XRE-family HTH domain